MKARGSVAAELSWPQVHAFRLERHHLTPKATKKDLASVVGEICGAHAQVMSAAEMQIAVRVGCPVDDVRNALWKSKTLVKTWLMRGTLHLIRSEDLPLYTAAMRTRWIRVNRSWLKFMGVSEPELGKLVDDIGDALNGTPLTREELIDVVGKGRPAKIREILKSGWGGMLKPAARNGRLCFGPNRGQSVTFVRPQEWLGSWSDIDPDQALVEVARRYLRAYSPATKTDFQRWWGNWPGVGNAAWSGMERELVQVSVDGARQDMLATEVDAVKKAKIEDPVQLLPSFDPYLMGHATRDHLFERIHASRVSRTAGWISAVVLVNGSVAATWTHTLVNRTLRVTVEPFGKLSSAVKSRIKERVDVLAGSLGATKTEVKVA